MSIKTHTGVRYQTKRVLELLHHKHTIATNDQTRDVHSWKYPATIRTRSTPGLIAETKSPYAIFELYSLNRVTPRLLRTIRAVSLRNPFNKPILTFNQTRNFLARRQ